MGFWTLTGAGSSSAESARQSAFERIRSESARGWRGVPAIAALLTSTDVRVVAAACTAIEALVAEVPVQELPALDQAMRTTADSVFLKPATVARLSAEAGAGAAVLGVLGCAPNGFVREAAIQALRGATAAEAVPFLLLRANDWVLAIRNLANLAIRDHLRPEAAPAFVRGLPLVARLGRAQRADHAQLVREIGELLSGPGREALLEGLRASDRMVRRACVAIALNDGSDDAPSIAREALADADVVVATAAAEFLCRTAGSDALHALMPHLMASRVPRVRAAALTALAEQAPALARGWLMEARFDTNSSVRDIARYYLRREPDLLSASRYRAELEEATGSPRPGALAALSEVGAAGDAAAVLRFLEPEWGARVRKEALRCIAKLEAESAHEALMKALRDKQPGLSRVARELLSKPFMSRFADELVPLLKEDQPPHVRRNALGVLLHTGRWSGLRWAVRVLEDEAHPGFGLARRYVRGWVERSTRSFSTVSEADSAAIRASLKKCEASLPAALLREIERALNDWRSR